MWIFYQWSNFECVSIFLIQILRLYRHENRVEEMCYLESLVICLFAWFVRP